MGIAALATWLLTAVGGFILLGTWIAKGGLRSSRLPPALVFGHFALAAAGLVLWIIYLISDTKGLAWTALVLLVPVALLGFVSFARWIPVYRAADQQPAEKHFPVVVVGAHGVFAVATVVLAALTTFGVS
jgi:manganese efflux pump family protein